MAPGRAPGVFSRREGTGIRLIIRVLRQHECSAVGGSLTAATTEWVDADPQGRGRNRHGLMTALDVHRRGGRWNGVAIRHASRWPRRPAWRHP